MEEKINQEFEDFQKELRIRSKKLKPVIYFNPREDLDEIFKELKEKKITL